MDSANQERGLNGGDRSPLAQHEARVTRLAWGVGAVTLLLTGVPFVFVVATQASQPWHYLLDAVLVFLPVGFGVPMAAYIRHQHISLLRRFQTQLIVRTAELQEMAARDELTHLYNRRYFYNRLQEAIERARLSKEPLSLLLVDADGLKSINDNYGHNVGDIVIKNLAALLAKHVRANDVVARLGGDEFGIILPKADKRGAFSLAHRLLGDLTETPIYQEGDVTISLNMSIGVSGYPWGGDSADEMVHWADADMYANKVSRKLAPASWSKEAVPDIEAAPSDYT